MTNEKRVSRKRRKISHDEWNPSRRFPLCDAINLFFLCLEWVRIYMPTYYSRTEASERNNHYPARRPYSNTAFTTRLTLPDIQSTVTIKKNLPRGERRNYSLLDTPTLLYRNQNLENESFIVMLVVGPGARLVWIGVVSLAFCSTGL